MSERTVGSAGLVDRIPSSIAHKNPIVVVTVRFSQGGGDVQGVT